MPTSSPSYLARLRFLDIDKLESLPIFDEIVHKLVAGQSPLTVAKWCHEQKIEPCGLFTWKRRLESLARRVKSQMKTAEPAEKAKVATFAVQQLISPKKAKEFEIPDAVGLIAKLDASMMAAITKISAETILKIAFVIQHARVKQMVDLETRLGMPFAWGHQNLEVLNKIGQSVGKLEIGESNVQGKKAGSARGPYPGDLLPNDPESQQPHAFDNILDGFDYVDRNLIRAASQKVIEIMAAEVKELEGAEGDSRFVPTADG
jgi:hypothetical protein